MPRPNPVPSSCYSMLQQFRRIMKWMALFSIVIAATAVLLVMRGAESDAVYLLIATALGVGLLTLLATGLMSLTFLSSSSAQAKDEDR